MWVRRRFRILRRATRFLADERGAAALVLALVFPVMVGGMALGTEAGYWFLSQRQLQRAADLAAHAAAVAKRSGGTATEMRQAALQVARGSGFEDARDTLALFTPPDSGAYAGQEDGAEVRITREQTRYFTQIYAQEPIELRARAVAAVEGGATACLLALSPGAPRAVSLGGSSNVSFKDCDVASNSVASDSFYMYGGSLATTGCVNAAGGAETTAGLTLTDCAAVNDFAPVVADPYSPIPEPDLTGPCKSSTVGSPGTTTVLTPTDSHHSGAKSMHFCAGLSVSGNVTFEPGVYLIEGGSFKVNSNAVLKGSEVTFYLADGVDLSFSGSATFDLTAPSSGPYAGLLIFGSRTSTVQHSVNGAAGSVLNGAIYTPKSHLNLTGDFTGAAGGGCTQIVTSTVTVSGNATLEVNCAASGTRPILARQKVRLVE